MGKLIDLTGKTFTYLTVIGRSPKRNARTEWLCCCQCGATRVVDGQDLQRAKDATKSCGCYIREVTAKRSIKHGGTAGTVSNEARTYYAMKARCYNPKSHLFDRWGGRGIKVCDRWLDSFANFVADMGSKPTSKHSLDRIDNDGDYTPENCRWATPREQARNRSSSVLHDGKTLAQWSEETGIHYQTLSNRLLRGWTLQRAVTEPVRAQHRQNV